MAAAAALRARRRSVRGHQGPEGATVTDEIDTSTEHGIQLKSGREVTGEIAWVTVTGFNLSVLGDIDFTIDGVPAGIPRHDHAPDASTGVPTL